MSTKRLLLMPKFVGYLV